jgi:2-polyprenyl-6-hydroxyphenyl methylase/3-demethylubiquinone-9 3-methyltransferase
MIAAVSVALAVQAAAMLVDEVWFHHRRELPRWERIGHPLDTLTIVLCLAWLTAASPTAGYALPVYVGLAVFSTLFVTKDEAVHARLCNGGEQWLHAILFVVHPLVLIGLGLIWWSGAHPTVLVIGLVATLGFASYQALHWNLPRRPRASRTSIASHASGRPRGSGQRAPRPVNNAIYAELGARWYDADDDPVALLRAEARLRNPWVAERLGPAPCAVLDVGCGAGFLANDLARRGYQVTGLDASAEALEVARARDDTASARYTVGDACTLPYDDASFDAVCAMDLLEHVEAPERVIAEAARVLRPGGLLFFHTFNRTWQAHLIVIKGVEWFVRNTPRDLHVLQLFVTPGELAGMCQRHGLAIAELRGSRPRFRGPLWRMLATGRVSPDLQFTFTRSLKLGYTGCARKLIAAG